MGLKLEWILNNYTLIKLEFRCFLYVPSFLIVEIIPMAPTDLLTTLTLLSHITYFWSFYSLLGQGLCRRSDFWSKHCGLYCYKSPMGRRSLWWKDHSHSLRGPYRQSQLGCSSRPSSWSSGIDRYSIARLALNRIQNIIMVIIGQTLCEGFDSCDRPSNLTQIAFKSLIFRPLWPWNQMDNLEKQ